MIFSKSTIILYKTQEYLEVYVKTDSLLKPFKHYILNSSSTFISFLSNGLSLRIASLNGT